MAARQLLLPSFAEDVLLVLRHHGLPPNALELELSEEIVARRTATMALDMLRHLDGLGVELAFDDFGTGYSSIFQLRSFPGHRLKIDRSFISRMLLDPTDSAVIRGLIDLAHGLRLRVVAEGVETPEQADTLIDYGCDELQGFLFSRPVTIQEVLSAHWMTGTQAMADPGNGRATARRPPAMIAPRDHRESRGHDQITR